MTRKLLPKLLALALTAALLPSALAAAPPTWGPHASPAEWVAWGTEEQGSGANSARQGGVSKADFATTSYPTFVTRSEDGAQIRKVYDLGPEEDPAGIPRSDFEQEGYHYTLTDLLKQESPEREERYHTETVALDSKSKDMASVLALLPSQREFTTDDGLTGTLSLQLETVKVDVAGYGSSTRAVSATRSYPNLSGQDTQYIPKSIEDNGHSLACQTVNWKREGDGHFTAVASNSGAERRSKAGLERQPQQAVDQRDK